MTPLTLLIIYSLIIVASSLMGGWLPSRMKITHTGTQVMMSFVAGLMLGIAFYHLLPHAVFTLEQEGGVDTAMWWLMIGLLSMFVLLRAFHFHQHGPLDHGDDDHHHGHPHPPKSINPSSWVGIALGLALHTLIDGVALGAAMQAGVMEAAPLGLLGLGVFVAIVLHKPLDAMSITTLMAAGGWSESSRMRVNFAFSLMCPLGALLFFSGADLLPIDKNLLVGAALAFSAGVFICISMSDLLPEIQFHSHDRGKLTVALLLGIAMSFAVGLIEPAHESHAIHDESASHEDAH